MRSPEHLALLEELDQGGTLVEVPGGFAVVRVPRGIRLEDGCSHVRGSVARDPASARVFGATHLVQPVSTDLYVGSFGQARRASRWGSVQFGETVEPDAADLMELLARGNRPGLGEAGGRLAFPFDAGGTTRLAHARPRSSLPSPPSRI